MELESILVLSGAAMSILVCVCLSFEQTVVKSSNKVVTVRVRVRG